MQIPKRRSEQFKKRGPSGPVYLTQSGIDEMKQKLTKLEADLPAAIKEVERTKEYGDFSENAEYKEAKHKLRWMHAQVFKIKHQLDKAVLIEVDNKSNRVQIGSTVTVEINGEQKQYQILGFIETNPGQGKISNHSPIGSSLLGHQVGDSVIVNLKDREVVYKIVSID